MKNTKKIALCGVVGALSITLLLMGSIIPMATYACPALAAILILPIVYEYKEKTAFTMYLSVSILSTILIPEKEFVMMYVFVFGLYTVFKFKADKVKPKILQFILKGLYAIISTVICYSILLFIFPSPILTSELSEATSWIIIAFFILFTLTFILYDFSATVMFRLYYYKFRKRLFR